MNQNKGDSCKGVEKCSESGPLAKYGVEHEERICKGCPLFNTKPERKPEWLIPHMSTAITLGELQRSGAVFNYPAALTPSEWAALAGQTRGTEQAESLRRKREEKNPKGNG